MKIVSNKGKGAAKPQVSEESEDTSLPEAEVIDINLDLDPDDWLAPSAPSVDDLGEYV